MAYIRKQRLDKTRSHFYLLVVVLLSIVVTIISIHVCLMPSALLSPRIDRAGLRRFPQVMRQTMRCHSSLPQKKPSEMKAEEVIEFVSSIEDLNEREKATKAFQRRKITGLALLDCSNEELENELGLDFADARMILSELRNREKSFRESSHYFFIQHTSLTS
mmetsp:Transcript_23835/g.35730  ORF Transcript_23835/g.35730 Transcript_23835/m.35730 type:complete len:162 (-) Transcript_23835:761-1246(-)